MARAAPIFDADLTLDLERFGDALLRNSLSTFIQATFQATVPGAGLLWHPYLDLIASRLQDVVEGRTRHLIITLPPRHLKSFCASVAMPAFYLGHHPTAEIMVVSYGQSLAERLGEQTRAVMSSAIYERTFSNRLLTKRQPPHLLRTTMGGIRRATSIDGVATGVGADLLIFDDPQKPGETLSDAVRRSTNEQYENTFLSRRNNPATARIVVVMQRLHEEDFVGHVRSLGGDWEILNLPAIAEAAESYGYRTCFGPARYTRREGEVLHPARISLEQLMKDREIAGEAAWATQYQQRPAPSGGGIVKTEWFKSYADQDLPAKFDRVVQSWDTANKASEFNDYSVCTTWGAKDGRFYLLNVLRERMLYPFLKRAVVDQARIHKATVVLIEDRASGTQLIQDLKHENFSKVKAVSPSKDKVMRMSDQTAPIENGFVYLPVQAHWLSEYLHELLVFPKGKYDDQIDSTSQALAYLNGDHEPGIIGYYRQMALEEGLEMVNGQLVPIRR